MSKIVGVDLGTTLTKFAWEHTDPSGKSEYKFAVNIGKGVEWIVEELTATSDQHKSAKIAIVTGINEITEKLLSPLLITRPKGDAIDNEIMIQANGVRELLGDKCPANFLLVSIGTGTSYTIVGGSGARRFPFGNGIGGGFVAGILELASISPSAIDDSQSPIELEGHSQFPNAKILDILVKEVQKSYDKTPFGDFSIAHFGRAREGHGMQSIIATALNCVATTVVRDIAKLDMIPDWKPPHDVVIIGSLVAKSRLMRRLLDGLFNKLNATDLWCNHRLIIPPNSEYAGALGALLCGK